MMTVHWQKCNNYSSESWCRLNSEFLDDPRLKIVGGRNPEGSEISVGITGVYIIWAGIGDNRTILKVGSGIIKDRLRTHLNDPKVRKYEPEGLYVTWASFLPLDQMRGIDQMRSVEKYLGHALRPIFGERFPANVEVIAVNLPEWDEPLSPLLRGLIQR